MIMIFSRVYAVIYIHICTENQLLIFTTTTKDSEASVTATCTANFNIGGTKNDLYGKISSTAFFRFHSLSLSLFLISIE